MKQAPLQLAPQGHPSSAHSPEVLAAVERLASHGGIDALGSVFTRAEVVEFILDLVGYTEDRPLHQMRLLEPSFGGGDFLLIAVRRLLHAWRRHGGKVKNALADLSSALRAIELQHLAFSRTREAVLEVLVGESLNHRVASELADHWLIQGDFLLVELNASFEFVIGNPPYVRQELIPDVLIAEYRRRYSTIFDRADIYVPFIERSLRLLTERGVLGFICADRWMKNRYGGPLRNFISKHYHLKAYVDMVDTPAFHSEVIAYPAITVIARERSGPTRIAHRPKIDRSELAHLADIMNARELLPDCSSVREIAKITDGNEPWLLESSDQMTLIRRLEQSFPALEDVGCKVGIGVATGADKVFIADFDSLDVEPDRKVPLAMTKDIATGEVKWTGKGVINPYAEQGGLVNLSEFPRLRRYLEERREQIAGRHCVQKTPASWYRTIDKITPSLARKPKLLIPDIKGEAHIVYESGELYPHHNLYYVTSEHWELRALQAVLLSEVTRLFIATYSTKMRGGFLRFQAQYLRRIRLPAWESVPSFLREELKAAAVVRDIDACNRASFKLYGLSKEEKSALGGE